MNSSTKNPLHPELVAHIPNMALAPKTFLAMEILWMMLIVAGNTTTILAVAIHKKLRTTINRFIVSLCAANLLYGTSVVYRIVFFTTPVVMAECHFCCVLHFVALLVPALGILYGLAAMTIDRYVAVLHPLRYPQLMGTQTVTAILVAVWTISIVTGCLPLVWNNRTWDGSSVRCNFLSIIPKEYVLVFVVTPAFLSNFVVLYVYARIWRESHRQLRRISALGNAQLCVSRKELRTTMTVFLVVLSCVMALMPFFTVLLLASSNISIHQIHVVYPITFEISFINPILTPLIYVWRSSGFKEAVRSMICCPLRDAEIQERRNADATEATGVANTVVNSKYLPDTS